MKIKPVDDKRDFVTLGPFVFEYVSDFDGFTIYKQTDSSQENLIIVRDLNDEVVRGIRFNEATDKLEIL